MIRGKSFLEAFLGSKQKPGFYIILQRRNATKFKFLDAALRGCFIILGNVFMLNSLAPAAIPDLSALG